MAYDPRATEPNKTSQTPDEEQEWRGGDQRQGREAQERSGERGWGTGNAGGQRQQGDGGQAGGDIQNQNKGKEDERGDASRRQANDRSASQGEHSGDSGEPSDRAGSGQGAKKN